MRIPRSGGRFARVRNSRGVNAAALRHLVRGAASCAVLATCAAAGIGAPAQGPGARPDTAPASRPERPVPSRPVTPVAPANPIVPVPPRAPSPVTPVNPIVPVAPTRPARPPATPPAPVTRPGAPGATGGPGTPAPGEPPGVGGVGGGGGGGGASAGPEQAVPRGMMTSGLTAGRGSVQVRYFTDLGDVASASAHLSIIPGLLGRVAADGVATLAIRPLVVTGQADSAEAACALVAAGQQNRAWQAAHHLAATRVTTDGDWVSARTLRSVARKVAGLDAARFVRAAVNRACFPRLNRLRTEARAAGVGSSPEYVITGARGATRLPAPATIDQVIEAIASVA